MDNVSIILTTRHSTGNNEVEVTGQCEKEYNELALYAFSADIIKLAHESEGQLIPWRKEKGHHQFCLAFRFESMEQKKEFLSKLPLWNGRNKR